MQSQINLLKENLNYLIQLNDDSLELLNLQALFLENLSFSEKDINLLQINKYRKKGYIQKYLNRQNEDDILSSMVNSDKFDEKTCIIFASYNDAKTLTINQVSSNFSNLFCFTSRDHIYDKNIESIIPLAFQSVHKMYIKQYLEDSITCDISSINTDQQLQQNEQDNENDSNEVTPDNQAQNYQFIQSKYLSEKQTGIKNQNYELQNCKMNQQIIFASLNQMFILPIKIDIRTNEYKENGTFGLVAKIKKINEEYQYALFNQTDLSVIGLTKQMHEIFFPNCNNLQKINLRQIFPFLIGTQNKTKIEDSQVQNNETICNATNIKNQFHANLQHDIILRGQLKNKLKIKNKLSFIVIQHSDEINNTLNSSCNNIKRLNKAKLQKEIPSYSFNYVELFVRKLKYKGVNNVSYVEIIKIRQLNPAKQANIILKEITKKKKQNIYSQLFENPNELQNIISDLELNQNTNSYLQFNSFYTQLQNSCINSNQSNKLQLIKENDTAIDFAQADFYKQQQLLNKQQTLGDESTNLEQIKMVSNRIEYEDLSYQSDGGSSLALNKFKEQKGLQKLNKKLQLNQLDQLQNNIAQEKTLIQSIQGNLVSKSDLQIKVDFLNKNMNFQNLQEDQFKTSSYYALPSPEKLNKTIDLELNSLNNSYYLNINSNQQSLDLLSDQNFNIQQMKQYEIIQNKTQENIYLDVETSNREINKKQNTAISPLKISKNPSIFKSNSFRKKKVNNTLINALSNREKKQLLKNPYQNNHHNKLYKNKNIKKQQVQDILYDIASNNSQNSYYTPVKRQLEHIMEDQSTQKVIKLIKMIGIICFSIMICITLIQFNSMQQYLSQANQEYEDFSWPTTYSSYLSDILKYKNIQFLISYANINFRDSNQKQLFYNKMQQNMEDTFLDVLRLLAQMELAYSKREMFTRILENKIVYYFGQLYNPQLLNSITSDTQLISINYPTNLQYSMLLNVVLRSQYHYIIIFKKKEILQFTYLLHFQFTSQII
ncbi:hypothetical protein TTHERM_00256780 (macronuclear) [Tetrahymena thermophila SB210]|uniref:Uncharacterized protein n=1 Tax=Tetrahymena thermophila (strain SB210) TaxID=312017 RepID=Q23QK0_TETTS|nr:hypothetical protein TTHERM_00256780 [Tetrahymena thermophila SB210]EAR98888.2 hypothetical protein TTHERM_00256780 [Tetrahymena thermophila SB210]|eukprot:XP_001019133.2 hypothetical protein TTHERM_00256780 [Tetrahymena thermophila SB210]